MMYEPEPGSGRPARVRLCFRVGTSAVPGARRSSSVATDSSRARGVGLWIVEHGGQPVGFCGFRIFQELGSVPQLLYALLEPWTGRGFATEIGRALVELRPFSHAVGADPRRR